MRIRHRLLHTAVLAACVVPASPAVAMPAAASVAPPPPAGDDRPALSIPPGLDKWFDNPNDRPTLHIPERPDLHIPVLTAGLPPH